MSEAAPVAPPAERIQSLLLLSHQTSTRREQSMILHYSCESGRSQPPINDAQTIFQYPNGGNDLFHVAAVRATRCEGYLEQTLEQISPAVCRTANPVRLVLLQRLVEQRVVQHVRI